MKNIIEIKNEYNSLETLYEFLKTTSPFECIKDYDKWELRIDANGEMEQCIVLKKNAFQGLKLFFVKENVVKVNHIIPSTVINALFGKSKKYRQNIIELVTEKIKEALLLPGQKKAFKELQDIVERAAA